MKEVIIDGIVYVPKKTNNENPYVLVRTYSAGVFCGYLKSRNGQEVKLSEARRLWYWSGAATLSQLAIEGVKNPEGCKFPEEVEEILLLQAIEIIPMTETAKKSVKDVQAWKA